MRGRSIAAVGEAAVLPLLLFVAWWLATANSTSVFFPPLRTILSETGNDLLFGPLPRFLRFSLGNLAAGLGLATVAGVGFGLLLGLSPALNRLLDPALQFFRALPKVTLVPLIIGALGIGPMPKVLAIALGCVWPILLNTIDGVRGLETGHRDMARAYRLSPRLRLVHVVFPGALPQIVAGVRVALSVGVVIMVVSEIYGAEEGLGYYILSASRSFEVAKTWGGTLLVGLTGYALATGFAALERRMLSWHHDRALRT